MKKLTTLLTVAFLMIASFINPMSVSAETDELAQLQQNIDKLAQQRVDDGTTPGITVLIKHGDELLHHKSYGYAHLYDFVHNDADPTLDEGILLDNPRAMTNDTLYDLASVTKVMATTQAVMLLVDRGQLDLDKPVHEYIPGFEIKGKDYITARDLLTHTSGLPQWEPTFLHVDTRVDELEYVKNLELMFDRGVYKYSDFSFIILAFVVEAISGNPIEVFLENNLYGPLGMTNTMFVPLKNGVSKDKIAATSWGNPYEWRMSNQRDFNIGYDTSAHQDAFDAFTGWRWYTLIGEVNDGNAGMANEGVAGHAGLFSTAEDLSKIGDMMLNNGTLGGTTYYDETVIDEFIAKDPLRGNRGLGWESPFPSTTSGYVGPHVSDKVFSHAGFTGTQVIFDKEYDLQIIILANKQNNGIYNANGSYYSPYPMSREISQLVYEYVDPAKKVDKSELETLYTQALNLDLSKYLTSSIGAIDEAAEDAKGILDNLFATQAQVDEQTSKLDGLIKALILKGNSSALEELIDEIEKTDLSNKTEETVLALEEALKDAKALVSENESIQSDYDAMYTRLNIAFKGLKDVEKTPEPTPTPTPTPEKDKVDQLPSTGFTPIVAYLGFTLTLVGLGLVVLRKKVYR